MKQPTFQMSADARLLMQVLQKAAIGDTVTYERLTAAISRPVAGGYGPLVTALRRLLRDHDMVFAVVHKVGLKRLNDSEIVAEGASAADSIRRKAARSIERQNKADFSKLNREEQARFSAQTAIMATVAMMTRQTSISRIENRVASGIKQLPIADTLKMFAKGAS
ncbi:MAG: hypothetical protein EOR85_12820 [Mesorhizobium sp.]|uniref:hypothetical protein n=1 Tax=Mesorhizobium sp. TaxID=1871066 RepID=UPI000FE4725E|nr:hypothetical protein [Mesorhizobium sp.]RWK61829.1 MAG: hypothetical protein EOR49_16215 [Mesorhizobium sp.]RWM47652.1 MAG: hypothetical protein EOR76_14145 [Mesorhizobium sp.]RWN02384.1 MAG: hypothetical protein EOR85_12820 [Mesorhizobium sp.]TJV33909.1 MAG: hypothetical protein E5X87_11410 [Mesorhizobium sp.]